MTTPHHTDLCDLLFHRHTFYRHNEDHGNYIQKLCNIVAGVSSQYCVSDKGVQTPCLCQTAEGPCKGKIIAKINKDDANIHWRCTHCREKGIIENWGKTFYNCLNVDTDIKH